MSISRGLVTWFVLTLWCSSARKAYPQPNDQMPQVPALFIFGDSLVDNGNNNGILTLARANYMPYGLDFPQGTTGRFTNGRTFVDILGVALYFLYRKPVLNLVKTSFLRLSCCCLIFSSTVGLPKLHSPFRKDPWQSTTSRSKLCIRSFWDQR